VIILYSSNIHFDKNARKICGIILQAIE